MGTQPLTMAMLVPCPIHCALKLTRGCQESIPGMKNDVTFSCCGHINHAITISSSLDTDLDFSPPPLPNSLHSRVTDFSLLLHFYTLSLSLPFSLSLPPSLAASSADAPCHSSYFSLLKFPNWSQLEPQRGGGRQTEMGRESACLCVCVFVWQRHRERESKINEPVLRVVILATGLHLTTDCRGNNTRDGGSDWETDNERHKETESHIKMGKQNRLLMGEN